MIPGIVNVVLLNKRRSIISPAAYGQGGASNVFNRGKGLSTRQKALTGAVQPDYLNSIANFGDQYFPNVVLLMGFEGTNGSTGAPGMTDESLSAHGTATVHHSAQISTSQFEFGASSLSLNNPTFTSDWINFPNSNDFNFSNGNFTIECWIYLNSAGTRDIVGEWVSGNFSWVLATNTANELSWSVSVDGSATFNDLISPSNTILTGQWYFVTVDYDGIKYRMYINGVTVASSTTSRTLFNSAAVLSIGSDGLGVGSFFIGYLDELRITKGVARYATDTSFTVPTAPFPRN